MNTEIDWEQLSNEWFERLAVYMEKTKKLETEIESLVAQRFSCRVIAPLIPNTFRALRALESPLARLRFPIQRGHGQPRTWFSGRLRSVPNKPHPHAQSPLVGPCSNRSFMRPSTI